VLRELRIAGWSVNGRHILPPAANGKEDLRRFHRAQRAERLARERWIIDRFSGDLLNEFAAGAEVDPKVFFPELIPVMTDTWEAYLFRFATLLWSIPVSRGYGRRLRYLVRDRANGKLVGLFALGDPVFNLRARDEHIGWDARDREARMYHVMDAYVLGAVPPYSFLLGGKAVALAAVCDEVRQAFAIKYSRKTPLIEDERKAPSLVLLTTTSGLGRSSIYNRLRIPSEFEPVYRSVGYSRGWGHFHISDELFGQLRNWLRRKGDPYADGNEYGDGPNWRLRTIRRALETLGFEEDLLHHGIQREVFVAPLAVNYKEYLRGEHERPRYLKRPLAVLAPFFRERWMLNRSRTVGNWQAWNRQDTWRCISESLHPSLAPGKPLIQDR